MQYEGDPEEHFGMLLHLPQCKLENGVQPDTSCPSIAAGIAEGEDFAIEPGVPLKEMIVMAI